MPKYIVPIDVITVHLVPVLAPTADAAETEAERIVEGDRKTWYDHTEPLCVGDALTEAEWDAQQESLARTSNSGHPAPPRAHRPNDTTSAARPRAPRTDHHADGTACPPEHRHTTSGKPLTPGCTGRAYSKAACTCGEWSVKSSGKGYVDDARRQHLSTAH
ncbi:hypothetical protein ACIA8O_00775 [Kitasatospora sp. NPDC051853]|uniref:hypothetical protein n=1 Tax=Kitasatospora sp. NPDC051853 TaxID=3364058 RepID=UPI0037AD53EA